MPAGIAELPRKGTKLFRDGREVGQIVNALWSPALGANLALGYVRKECNQPGTEVSFENAGQPATATVQALPFRPG